MTPAERRALEETVAAIRLHTRHHDPYEEWERDTKRDALVSLFPPPLQNSSKVYAPCPYGYTHALEHERLQHTARHLRMSTNATHAAHLQSTHNSALLTQHRTYTSQLADVQRLLERIHIKQRDEEERMRQRWGKEDRARKERIETVIRAEEEKMRARIEAERRRREEEERRRREVEDRLKMEEEQRRKLEKAKMKAKEEEERQEREREEIENRRREKEDADAEGRRSMGMVSAQEDWKYARETLKVRRSSFSDLKYTGTYV